MGRSRRCVPPDGLGHSPGERDERGAAARSHPPGEKHEWPVWIGLNDFAEEGSWVWSDDEPLEYDQWPPGEPSGDGDGAVLFSAVDYRWNDEPETNLYAYICAKKATPIEASGGDMLGCQGGHWVMGVPYTATTKVDLPPTTAFGIYKPSLYEAITPVKIPVNETAVPTQADVRQLQLVTRQLQF